MQDELTSKTRKKKDMLALQDHFAFSRLFEAIYMCHDNNVTAFEGFSYS